jgi:Protein of unknown function (DUF295)/F-box domain
MAPQQTLVYHGKENSPCTDRSESPDWSDLPLDLLPLISRKLTDICDFVRFRVVCKTWRSAIDATSDLAPQLPWIIENSGKFDKGYLRFYSLLTGKTHIINFPESSDKAAIGSAYNYMFGYNYKTTDCYLFNPLTKEEFLLPQTMISYPICVPSSLCPDQSLRYVGVSLPPTINDYFYQLGFCRLGDLEWTRIYGDRFPRRLSRKIGEFANMGFTFYNGMCYATDRETGSTKIINLTTRSMIYVVPRPEPDFRGFFVYLVVSFGVILRICQYIWISKEKPYCFVIYRLELGSRDGKVNNGRWIKIDSLINQFLFLDENHGCAFRADDFPGFLGNCIYFIKTKYGEKTFELCRYDIKLGEMEVLHVPMKLGSNWFLPSLCSQLSNYQL